MVSDGKLFRSRDVGRVKTRNNGTSTKIMCNVQLKMGNDNAVLTWSFHFKSSPLLFDISSKRKGSNLIIFCWSHCTSTQGT